MKEMEQVVENFSTDKACTRAVAKGFSKPLNPKP